MSEKVRDSAVRVGIQRRLGLYPVVTFYALAFGISWLGFAPVVLRSWGYRFFASPLWMAGFLLGAAGPGVAAAVADWGSRTGAEGRFGTRLRAGFLRSVSWGWWVITVLLSVGIMVAAAVLTRFGSPGPWLLLRPVSLPAMLLFTGLSLVANPIEEIGWRGFAQPRLEARYPGLGAAGIVGVLWAAWHVPLFLLASGPMAMSQTPFWPWAAGVVPQAVLLAWLYHKTRHSLTAVSVFHILGNVAGSVFDSSEMGVSAVRMVAALVVVGISGAGLGRPER